MAGGVTKRWQQQRNEKYRKQRRSVTERAILEGGSISR